MKTIDQIIFTHTLRLALLSAAGLAIGSLNCPAQSITASGTITGVPSGGNYNYSLSIVNSTSSTSPIGSFWYAWTPAQFYLPSAPVSEMAPAGWSATAVGHSIQFVASSSANYVAAGASLGGFEFTTPDSPAMLAGNATSQGFPSTPVGTTVAYGAALFSTPSETFVFTTIVPEPSSLGLAALVALSWLAFYKRSRRLT